MTYEAKITKLIPNVDPRHVLAWMRSNCGTLDALSPAEFSAEARKAAACVDEVGTDMSERLAASFGIARAA